MGVAACEFQMHSKVGAYVQSKFSYRMLSVYSLNQFSALDMQYDIPPRREKGVSSLQDIDTRDMHM